MAPLVTFKEPVDPPPQVYIRQKKMDRPILSSTVRCLQGPITKGHGKKPPPGGPPMPGGAPGAPRPPPSTGKPITNPALLKLGSGGMVVDRSQMLANIRGGIKLKKTVTRDGSGLILDEEQKDLINNRGKLNFGSDSEPKPSHDDKEDE